MRGHILVIDDEKYVYEDLEFGLGKAHEIHYAATLTRIRSILEKYPIDLAMVDLNIKVGDKDRFSGLEYIKTLRSKNPSMTIAVLSGYSDENRIVQATKNGADHYLLKGNLDTDSNEFRDKIRIWINSKRKLDAERELDKRESWGGIDFSDEIIAACLKLQDEKKSYLLIAEKGLGGRKLLDTVYRKSRYFKKGKFPEEKDLEIYDPLTISDYLALKRGTAQDNFFKNIPSKIIYLRNLKSQPISVQEMFLKAIQSGRYVDQQELHQLQFIFILDEEPEKLIKEGSLSTELYHALPILRLAPLRSLRGASLRIGSA
ncbi:MAG: response regulator, partial [Bacteroidota bacterium]